MNACLILLHSTINSFTKTKTTNLICCFKNKFLSKCIHSKYSTLTAIEDNLREQNLMIRKDEFDFDPNSESIDEKSMVKPLQFNELLVCKNFIKLKKGFKLTCRLVKLEPNGIFRNKTFSIFHEHIVAKSNSARMNSINYNMFDDWIGFKRPTLYEYVLLKEQQAVSSHFSIISLVPMLLEIEDNSKVLECGTGSGSMTMFLRYFYYSNIFMHVLVCRVVIFILNLNLI